jgi:uncharacterized protein YlxP (DUF503 family)
MVIGCCSIKFYLHGNNSLKGKRRVIRVIKDRLKTILMSPLLKWVIKMFGKPFIIGISAVGSNRPYMDGLMSKVVDKIDRMNLAEIVDCKTETLNMGSGDF